MEAWLQSKITSAEDKLNSVANCVTDQRVRAGGSCRVKRTELDDMIMPTLQALYEGFTKG